MYPRNFSVIGCLREILAFRMRGLPGPKASSNNGTPLMRRDNFMAPSDLSAQLKNQVLCQTFKSELKKEQKAFSFKQQGCACYHRLHYQINTGVKNIALWMAESHFQIWKAWKIQKNVAWCEVHTIMYKKKWFWYFQETHSWKKTHSWKIMFLQAFRGTVLWAIFNL